MEDWLFLSVLQINYDIIFVNVRYLLIDILNYSWDDHYENFVKGTRKYLLQEKDQDIDVAKKHLRK